MEQLRKIRAGDVRTASRLIRNLEDDLPEAKTAIKRIFPHTGRAHVVDDVAVGRGAPGACTRGDDQRPVGGEDALAARERPGGELRRRQIAVDHADLDAGLGELRVDRLLVYRAPPALMAPPRRSSLSRTGRGCQASGPTAASTASRISPDSTSAAMAL